MHLPKSRAAGARTQFRHDLPGTRCPPEPGDDVGAQIAEVLERHTELRGSEANARVIELLNSVGIPDPPRSCTRVTRFSFRRNEAAGMIAIALVCEPSLRSRMSRPRAGLHHPGAGPDLLRGLQKRMGMSIFLITHDLGVVAEMAHHVAVMYAGEIVEMAPRDAFFRNPSHPYSRKLFASVPNRRRGTNLWR